jgi:predicted SprT family Zn-dependent metalloprotease
MKPAEGTGGERPLQAALEMAAELMRQHGLQGWSVRLDHARRRAGQCDYTRRVISLSRHYVRHADTAHIHDTILHEIAHALVGPHHGHDAVWRRKAREIGCSATRCHTLTFATAPWVMRCPNGCFEVARHRRKSGLVCATCRTPVAFVPVPVEEQADG